MPQQNANQTSLSPQLKSKCRSLRWQTDGVHLQKGFDAATMHGEIFLVCDASSGWSSITLCLLDLPAWCNLKLIGKYDSLYNLIWRVFLLPCRPFHPSFFLLGLSILLKSSITPWLPSELRCPRFKSTALAAITSWNFRGLTFPFLLHVSGLVPSHAHARLVRLQRPPNLYCVCGYYWNSVFWCRLSFLLAAAAGKLKQQKRRYFSNNK